jgi:hypothetical protein
VRLVQTGMMVVPVLDGLLLGKSLLAGSAITADLLLGIGNILLIAVANVALGPGVALLNPAFSARWWTELSTISSFSLHCAR